MGRGRPGGNPGLKDFGYKKREDNHSDQALKVLGIRLEVGLIKKIKSEDNWTEKLRAKLNEIYADAD